MVKDDPIFDLIHQEEKRQIQGVELIASENFVSDSVLRATGSVLTNKYAEGLPYKRYYGGCAIVDQVETIALERLKKLFNASWANVQPHSGSQANAAVMLACLKPGDALLGFDLSHGGHLTHGSAVSFSGKLYRSFFYGIDKTDGRVDYDQMASIAVQQRPKLIIVGASAYSRDWDYPRVREIADQIGALVLADISHPSGLIAKGLLNDPLDHCHIVTSTTHKTLRGPRGGILLMRHDFENPFGVKTKSGKVRTMSSLLDSAVFPGSQGGPLEHIIAAKAVAFEEALSDRFKVYGQQVISNARLMADEFVHRGYTVISGGTDNHSILIDLRSKNKTGKSAEEALAKAHITVNKNVVPFDTASPFVTSGIRIGTPAVTTRGLKEEHLRQIVEWIDQVITHQDDDRRLDAIGNEVKELMTDFPLFAQ